LDLFLFQLEVQFNEFRIERGNLGFLLNNHCLCSLDLDREVVFAFIVAVSLVADLLPVQGVGSPLSLSCCDGIPGLQ